jgi:hypothetical protein
MDLADGGVMVDLPRGFAVFATVTGSSSLVVLFWQLFAHLRCYLVHCGTPMLVI